jgi:hypothetical protein
VAGDGDVPARGDDDVDFARVASGAVAIVISTPERDATAPALNEGSGRGSTKCPVHVTSMLPLGVKTPVPGPKIGMSEPTTIGSIGAKFGVSEVKGTMFTKPPNSGWYAATHSTGIRSAPASAETTPAVPAEIAPITATRTRNLVTLTPFLPVTDGTIVSSGSRHLLDHQLVLGVEA